MQTTIDDEKIKNLFKQALSELLTERKEEFQQMIAAALEDEGMTRAIEEGSKTSLVPKNSIVGWAQSEA